MNKKLILLSISLVLLFLLGSFGFYFYAKKAADRTRQKTPSEVEKISQNEIPEEEKFEKFTSEMFDSTLVKNILPLGELNGGYEEASAINGLMIITKSELPEKPDMEVRAPADMTLTSYSYHQFRTEPEAWRLTFQIDENLTLTFDHIAKASDKIKVGTASTPKKESQDQYPQSSIKIAKGEVIGYTVGKGRTKSFNLYFYDKRTKNAFINQDRFKERGQNYLTASCIVDYYDQAIREKLIPLFGYDEPGQTTVCNKVTRDVKGTLSGMWFLDKEGMEAKYEGSYASPFSIFLSSANNVILYETNRKRYILGNANKTFKDPATVTASQCYALTEYPDDRGGPKGYAFFKIVSETEMKMAYSATGSCPSTFPESIAKTYYR